MAWTKKNDFFSFCLLGKMCEQAKVNQKVLYKSIFKKMEKHQIPVLEDVLHRIDRLNKLVHKHEEQAKPDILAIEGYQKLKRQYSQQLKELLQDFELEIEILEKV